MAHRALGALREELVLLGLLTDDGPAALPPFAPLCPWGEDAAGMYGEQERHKALEGSQRATCGYCGKAFRAEGYLDQHLAARHPEGVEPALPCLATYCEELSCDLHADSPEDIAAYLRLPCLDGVMRAARRRCEALMDRCIGNATTPTSEGSSDGGALAAAAKSFMCERLTCERLRELKPEFEPLTTFGALWMVAAIVGSVAVAAFYLQLLLLGSSDNRERGNSGGATTARGGGGVGVGSALGARAREIRHRLLLLLDLRQRNEMTLTSSSSIL
jgi:hypothetical protein